MGRNVTPGESRAPTLRLVPVSNAVLERSAASARALPDSTPERGG